MIFLGRRHPTQISLSRFADGELSPRRQRRVGRHVQNCDSCRDYVRSIEDLGDAARDLPPAPVPDIADDVIRRRRAGERGHLANVPKRARSGWGAAGWAAAARAKERRRLAETIAAMLALVAVTASYLLLAPSAAATRGELIFEMTAAEREAAVPVVYSPAYYLAGEDSLRLRTRVTRQGGGADDRRRDTESRTVTLHRDGNGKFRGTLPLEDGDLFAVAAVEDFEAADLDTNFGRLWDLYLEHENGRPNIAALESHYRNLERYNWVLAVEWAERLTEEYPDNPLGWAVGYWHFSGGRGGSVPDSVREFHLGKLDELLRHAGGASHPDELAWLARYAGYLGETSVRDSLQEELARLVPGQPAALDRLVVQAVDELGFGSPALVARLEELWESGGHATEFLIHSGVQAAAASGQADPVETWLDRGLDHPDIETAALLEDIEPYEQAATRRASLLQMRLVELEAPGEVDRPLRMSESAYEVQRRTAIMSLEIELAGALADAGAEAAAAAQYREAASRAWRPEDLRPYVEFLLARGDTAAALQDIGLLVADPVSGDVAKREYSHILETGAEELFIARSREELRRRLLAALPLDRKLRHDTRVASIEGEVSTAGEFFADGPTVLLLWDARLRNGSRWLTTFKSLASREWARESGIQAAILIPPTGNDDLTRLHPGPIPLVVDPSHELVAQLGVRAVPSFVVVGQRLEVVSSLPDAPTAFRIAHLLAR